MNNKINSSQKKSLPGVILLIIIFLIGIGIRFYELDNPPLDFHPARQLHSALIARSFYLSSGGSLPDHDLSYTQEARTRGAGEMWIEPPIFEYICSRLYFIAGNADLTIPRICSIIFWMLGALGLVRLTRRFMNFPGTIICTAFFLLFPYTVIASRSFQPDPLMTAFLIWTIDALYFWNQKKNWWRTILLGFLAGCTILIKQVAVFPLFFVMAAFMISQLGIKNVFNKLQIWVIAVLSILPAAVYNYWGYFINGFLVIQYTGRFFWSEIITPAFYIRWIRKINEVFSLPVFMLGIMGTFVIKNKKDRAVFTAYILGYFIYGLFLPHHIGTHDYYQILAFPLISVGLGQLSSCINDGINQIFDNRKSVYIEAIFCLTALFGWWSLDSLITLKRDNYREWPARFEELAKELDPFSGQTNTIGLMKDYGAGMAYWGERTIIMWDQNVENMDQKQAFDTIYSIVRNRHFFMITDMESFSEQPYLQQFLTQYTSVYQKGSDYIIYDLREDLYER